MSVYYLSCAELRRVWQPLVMAFAEHVANPHEARLFIEIDAQTVTTLTPPWLTGTTPLAAGRVEGEMTSSSVRAAIQECVFSLLVLNQLPPSLSTPPIVPAWGVMIVLRVEGHRTENKLLSGFYGARSYVTAVAYAVFPRAESIFWNYLPAYEKHIQTPTYVIPCTPGPTARPEPAPPGTRHHQPSAPERRRRGSRQGKNAARHKRASERLR